MSRNQGGRPGPAVGTRPLEALEQQQGGGHRFGPSSTPPTSVTGICRPPIQTRLCLKNSHDDSF